MNKVNSKIDPNIDISWKESLREEFAKPYFSELKQFLIEEKKHYKIYPPGGNIFEAFNMTPLNKLKVVILGQDPYHGEGQAHGLCFSVKKGIEMPPSLKNIFTELANDVGINFPLHGELTEWAQQGVLLLNATLTVRSNQAGSHQGRGWETFTDAVIKTISDNKINIVFILWGNYAKSKKSIIDNSKHFILEAPHPSPLSVYRGFFGCKHFSKTNEYLNGKNIEKINWKIT